MVTAASRPHANGSGAVDDALTKRRRSEILLGACAVFDERGYANTRVADISTSLQVGQGTIYRYFTGKDDLMRHILDHAVNLLLSAMREDVGSADGHTATGDQFFDQIAAVSLRLLHIADSEPVLTRVLLNQAPAALPDAINELTDQLADATADYLRAGVQSGYLRADVDVAAVADAMTGIAIPAMRRVLRGDLPADRRESVARTIASLVARGVVAP